VSDIQLRWLLFVLTLTFTTPASSQDRDVQCQPTWATSDMPITENTFRYWSKARNEPVEIGPRLDANVFYWNRGALFRLPYGFFNPWFLSQTGEHIEFPELDEYLSNLSANSANTGYDASTGLFDPNLLDREDVKSSTISFWMPSLRYVEHNMRTGSGFRPCEPGREPPSDDEFVVTFKIIWPGGGGVEHSPQIERFENARSWRTTTPNDFVRFEDDFFVILRCSTDIAINPLCHGKIWDKSRGYILDITFPEHLRRSDPTNFWRTPFNAAIQLLESWKLTQGETDNG
jgi:hypothetical protein